MKLLKSKKLKLNPFQAIVFGFFELCCYRCCANFYAVFSEN